MEYIFKNGKSGYSVLLPKRAGTDEELAARELQLWLRRALGAELKIVADGAAELDINGRFISLGDTSLADRAGIFAAESAGPRGFVIKTAGNSVFIRANTHTGVLNGAYRLLNLFIGFEAFGTGTPFYREGIEELVLTPIDISDRPDITYNIIGNGAFEGVEAKRMRFENPAWMIINGGKEYHNSFSYIPPDKYKQQHPEWYSDDGTQLCYLAHGDSQSLDKMYGVALEVLKQHLRENLTANRVSFTQQDETTWCTCEHCARLKEKYGTDVVSMIWFLNRLGGDIESWFNSPEGQVYKRDFDICFFAYHATRFPPVKKTPDKGLMPADGSVTLASNVSVFFAPITADYHKSLDAEENRETFEFIDGWSSLSQKLYMWIYSTNYHYYLVPYNSFAGMPGTYRCLSRAKTYLLFDENQYNHANSTGFTALKSYLSSKLTWDSNACPKTLTHSFFEGYYGAAAWLMRECYDKLTAQFKYMEEELKFSGYVFEPSLKSELFPKKFLLGCLKLITKSKRAAGIYKDTDRQKYREIIYRITTESIAYKYLLIELYGGTYKPSALLRMKNGFKKAAAQVNITRRSEGIAIEDLYEKWGAAK